MPLEFMYSGVVKQSGRDSFHPSFMTLDALHTRPHFLQTNPVSKIGIVKRILKLLLLIKQFRWLMQ